MTGALEDEISELRLARFLRTSPLRSSTKFAYVAFSEFLIAALDSEDSEKQRAYAE
jgi:hypothetical protein